MPNTKPNTNTNSSKLKVLVVVDVQNCFIAGGSYGGHEKNSIDGDKLANSINQVYEISELIDSNDSIIFTRDYHPINHLSIGDGEKVAINTSKATHPTHCLNTNSNACLRKEESGKNLGLTNKEISNIRSRNYISIEDYLEEKFNIIKFKNNINNKNKNELKEVFLEIIPKELYKQKIIGTNLSWLYSITKYATIISNLINKKEPIGIKSKNKSINPKFSNITIPKPYEVNGKKFIELVKGQLCRYESYSAFNYHLKLIRENNIIKNGKTLAQYKTEYIIPKYEKTKNLKDLSTGLFEYILNTTKKNIEITVCGLVGEICVINTIVEGLIMWNLEYSKIKGFFRTTNSDKKVIFNYSLSGTLFTGLGLFGFNQTVKQTDFFNKMIDYLTNFVDNKYKTYIKFNVLDNNEYEGTIYYDSSTQSFLKKNKKLTFSNVNKNN